jgi:hypothetical protein
MKNRLQVITALVLATGVVCFQALPAQAQAEKKPAKHAMKAKPVPAATTVQLDQLRQEMETQINSLKGELAERDAKLKQAQQDAAAAQQQADRATAVAVEQQKALTDNAAAVTALSSTVSDLKGTQASIATTIQDDQAQMKKAIESPSTLHYKGITLTPGGFMAAETVWRSHATGGDIPTAFSAIPYEHADAYSLSEFYGSARQSRITLEAKGKTSFGTIRGYDEADFLGTGVTSNANQSNSYVMRQRIIFAEAALNNGWTFAAGQLWSLATEGKKGIMSDPSNTATPMAIDPNYSAGFVWARQYGFRVVKNFSNKAAIAVSAENPQILYTAALAGNTPYAVLGSAGANGGAYNAAVSNCSNSSYTVYSEAAGSVSSATKYLNLCSNLANISFNEAPDVIAKVALDPGFGHYELFGIGRFAHETVYPGITNNSFLYGGVTDTNGIKIPTLTTAGATTIDKTLGGIGASARFTIAKKLDLGGKVLYGHGVGHYGNTTLNDMSNKPDGTFDALKNTSFLSTLEFNATPRMVIYANFGGDLVDRHAYSANDASFTGLQPNITKASFTAASGTNPGTITFTTGNAAVGYGSALTSNAGCNTTSNPTYTGTGFFPGGACGAATHLVDEATLGYWYDIYKGPAGRLRQGLQYSYATRNAWVDSEAVPVGAKGIENMIFTSFRYYLP